MPYDFRPYIQHTKGAAGEPGNGVFIKMDDFYLFPDGHGNICAASVNGLPGLNQPFADAYQGMEIMAGIWRAMRKEIRMAEAASRYHVGDRVTIDGTEPGVIVSLWGGHAFKVKLGDGSKRLIKVGRISKAA